MRLNITDNIFINNSAVLEGGAIKWNDEMPIISNNTFENNTAVYGDNIASFPLRISLKTYEASGSDFKILSETEFDKLEFLLFLNKYFSNKQKFNDYCCKYKQWECNSFNTSIYSL